MRTKLYVLLTFISLLLAACGGDDIITVVITPTPDPDRAAQAATATPTIIPTITNTATTTATSTNTATPTNTPTVTPTPPDDVIPTRPTFLGPVVGTDYAFPTLPPPTFEPEIPTVTGVPDAAPSTPGPTPSPVPGLDPLQMGLQLYTNVTFNDFQQAVGLTEDTGVRWIKLQVNWGFLQPDGPNDWNAQMQLFERQVELASRPENMRVLLSVAKAPLWARSNGAEDGPPDDPQALADFLTFMLRDTKIGAAVDAIEIWNEPNLQREWQGTLPFNGTGYMQLFRPSYDAIRAYSPTMTIVTAGLAPTGNLGVAVDEGDFLQQMYNAGLAQYQDVVIGVHPYGWGNPPDARCCAGEGGPGWDDQPDFFFIENIETIRRIMARNNHDTEIWITEFGWSSWQGFPSNPPEAWHTYVNPTEQADYIIRAFQYGQQAEDIGPMFLWNLNFANEATVGSSNEIAGFSIYNPVLSPPERPAYWALSRSTGAISN
jgi:polysaccharide biosynthesis protein PslG